MKRQGKSKKPAPAAASSNGMSIDAILDGLDLLEDWSENIDFCKATIDILTALQDEGIKDPEQVRDLIHDYNALAEQYQKMHQWHEVAADPVRFTNGLRTIAHLCPDCRSKTSPGHTYCWNCGQRLNWGR